MLLAGRKGETKIKNKRIVGGRHVVFDFQYVLSGFGAAKPLDMPAEARKLLAASR